MPQYQGVWTLEQQAQAQSNQQWVTDPNFKNTTLLLQADGTGSGSQNQTFLDGSTNNFSVLFKKSDERRLLFCNISTRFFENLFELHYVFIMP